MNKTNFERRFQEIILKTKQISREVRIFFVTNTKNNTRNYADYENFSVATEFLSESELDDMVSGLRESGFYVDVYYEETDFMKSILNNDIESNLKKYNIVYPKAQKGTGPGRKSLLPSFCSLHNIPCIGSNAYVVSLCRHKFHYSKLLEMLGYPVAQSWLFLGNNKWLDEKMPPEGTMIIAKPTYEAASIGLDESSIMIMKTGIETTLNKISQNLQQPLTIQRFISGSEVEVPVFIIDGTPSSFIPVGISINESEDMGNEILTYDRVFYDSYNFYNYTGIVSKELLEIACKVARSIGFEDYGRVDFRITNSGSPFITDISTSPHLTVHGSYSHAIRNLNLEYKDLLTGVIGISLSRLGYI